MRALASVIIFIENQEFLAESLDSVVSQSLNKIEIICIDNTCGSEVADILLNYSKKDDRFLIVRNEVKKTRAESFNEVVTAKVKSDYISFLEVGDVFLPDKLERQFNYFLFWPELCAVGTQFQLKGRAIAKDISVNLPQNKHEIFKNPIKLRMCISSVMIKKSTFLSVGGFNEKFLWYEDYDLILRLSGSGTILNIPLSLLRFNIMAVHRLAVLRKGDLYLYKALITHSLSKNTNWVLGKKQKWILLIKRYISFLKYTPFPGHFLLAWVHRNKILIPFLFKTTAYGGWRALLFMGAAMSWHTIHYINWRLKTSLLLYFEMLKKRRNS